MASVSNSGISEAQFREILREEIKPLQKEVHDLRMKVNQMYDALEKQGLKLQVVGND
jgi:hypothetical protein